MLNFEYIFFHFVTLKKEMYIQQVASIQYPLLLWTKSNQTCTTCPTTHKEIISIKYNNNNSHMIFLSHSLKLYFQPATKGQPAEKENLATNTTLSCWSHDLSEHNNNSNECTGTSSRPTWLCCVSLVLTFLTYIE